MCLFQDFLKSFNKYLLNNEDCNNNIIRKHTKNLQRDGEFSFSLNVVVLRASNSLTDIFKDETVNPGQIEELFSNESHKWSLQIEKCKIDKDVLNVFLDRTFTFRTVIQLVLQEEHKYGSVEIDLPHKIDVTTDFDESDVNELDLSQLRAVLLKKTAVRLLTFSKCAQTNSKPMSFKISLQSHVDLNCVLFCGPVLSVEGKKNCKTTARDYLNKRTVDMRLMAQHKYGIRVKSDSGWREMFEKLGHAAVTIDLLQNKPSHKITININDYTCSSSKGASFILYNCARLAALFKDFDSKVEKNTYPALPDVDQINFSLLTQPEEWELLYLYVLQFPYVISGCIRDILNGKLNVHNLCNTLSNMSLTFSIYYRRVRILTEPRDHLFPVLHARIYLLKAVQQVLHNGLCLLNISPVKQM